MAKVSEKRGKMFDLDNHTGCGYGHSVHVYRIRQDGRWVYKVRLQYLVNDKVVDAVLMTSIDPGVLQCMVKDNLKQFIRSVENQNVIAQYVEQQLWKWDWTE